MYDLVKIHKSLFCIPNCAVCLVEQASFKSYVCQGTNVVTLEFRVNPQIMSFQIVVSVKKTPHNYIIGTYSAEIFKCKLWTVPLKK